MRSTMQDVPLTTSEILRHGVEVHGRTAEVATLTSDGVRRASYAEIGRNAARLAHGLRALGLDGDERVATFMWNNQEHLEAYLAVPSMGAVLHTVNIRLPPEQISYIVNHAEDRVLLVDGTLLPALGPLLPQLHTVRHVVICGPTDAAARAAVDELPDVEAHDYAELLAEQPSEYAWPVLDERDAAAICYSSGTTGNPKGVAYSHRSLMLHSMGTGLGDAIGLAPTDRVLPVVPMFHVMAWGIPYSAFLVGASQVMPDRFLQPEPLARLIAEEQVTVSGGVPTIWSALLAHLEADHCADVRSMRLALVGGAACPRALMEGFERHGVHVLHAWGMTETSPVGTVAWPTVDAEGEERWRQRLSQGRLASLVHGRIVGEDGTEAPWDGQTVGELEVRGPWIAASYLAEADDRDAGSERFHDGWLRTGDVGHIDADGFVTLTDRAKDVIKSGGEWISSVELENRLMSHEAVREAAVIGVPDERWGERPLGAVVVAEGASLTAEELRRFLADQVPRWQLPEHWAFVPEVPKTSVGKFDKKTLRQRYADGELEGYLAVGRSTS